MHSPKLITPHAISPINAPPSSFLSPTPPSPSSSYSYPAMARKKVNLSYITHDAVRQATFKRRCRGLLKKVNELSILCDVKACAVIYRPEAQTQVHPQQPIVFPSEPEARRMFEDFRRLPEFEQSKRMTSQAGFLHQRATKLSESYMRTHRRAHELEMKVMMYEAMSGYGLQVDLEIAKATELSCFVEGKLDDVRKRIAELKVVEAKKEEVAMAAEETEKVVEDMRKQDWFEGLGPTDGVGEDVNVIGGGDFVGPSCSSGNNCNIVNGSGSGFVDVGNGFEDPWGKMPDSLSLFFGDN